MECSICHEEIPVECNGRWTQGRNAEPVVENGRCCEKCDTQWVVPIRIFIATGMSLDKAREAIKLSH
jgi:hypothetical protein